jgi:hypothetical protein
MFIIIIFLGFLELQRDKVLLFILDFDRMTEGDLEVSFIHSNSKNEERFLCYHAGHAGKWNVKPQFECVSFSYTVGPSEKVGTAPFTRFECRPGFSSVVVFLTSEANPEIS